MRTEDKVSTSIRLTPKAKLLLELLAKHYGVNQSDMMEIIIREKAEKENVR